MENDETNHSCSRPTDSIGGGESTNGEERTEGERAETAAVAGESSLREGTSRAELNEGRRTSDNEGTESIENQSGFSGCLPQNMDAKTFSSIGKDDPGSENVPVKTIQPVLENGDGEMDDLDLVNEDSSQEGARSPTVIPDVFVQNDVQHGVFLDRLGLDMRNVLPTSKGQDDVQISMRRLGVLMRRAADDSEKIQRAVSCPGVLRREPNKDSDVNLRSGGITVVDPLPEQQTRNRSKERADQQVASPMVSLLPGQSEKTASEPSVKPTKPSEVNARQQDYNTPRAESPISVSQPIQQNHRTLEGEGSGNARDWSIRGAGAASNDENPRSFTTQQSQMTQVEESPCASPSNEEQTSKVESGSLDDQTQAEDCPNSDADYSLEARNEDDNQNSSRRNADVMASTIPPGPGESVENASQPPLTPTAALEVTPTAALEVDVRQDDCVNTARAESSDSHLVVKPPIHSVRNERVLGLQPTQDTIATQEANNEDGSESSILNSQHVGCGNEGNEISDREEVLHANPEIASVQNQLRSIFNNDISLLAISRHVINLQRTSVLPCALQIYSRLLDEPPEISDLDSMRNISAHFTNRVMRTTIIPRVQKVYTDYLQSTEQNAEKRNVNPTQNCNAFHIPNPGICVNSDSVNRSSNNEEETVEREEENINIPIVYIVRERNDRVEAEPEIPEICLVCQELVGEHECQFSQYLTRAFVDDGMEMEGRAFNDFSFSLQHLTHAFVDDGMEIEGRAFNDSPNV